MNNNIFKSLLLFSILFIEATCAHSQSYEVPLKNCSAKELTAFYYLKSLEPSNRYYEESKSVIDQAQKFIESKKFDENKSIASQLSTKDQLKLNSLLEKSAAYDIRMNIEKVNFRNLAVLIYMLQIIQDSDMDKDFLDKDPKATALLISMLLEWEAKENNFQPPFYEVKNIKSCNVYTLAHQIQLEFFEKVNASPEEIKGLATVAGAIMEKVNKDKNGLNSLTSDERKKYNRIRDVFPKFKNFKDNDKRLEQIKSVAYVSDLKYENAVNVWEKNLGNINTIDQSLQIKFSASPKYAKDFNKINNFLSVFDANYPYKDFYESARRNPSELFKNK